MCIYTGQPLLMASGLNTGDGKKKKRKKEEEISSDLRRQVPLNRLILSRFHCNCLPRAAGHSVRRNEEHKFIKGSPFSLFTADSCIFLVQFPSIRNSEMLLLVTLFQEGIREKQSVVQ